MWIRKMLRKVGALLSVVLLGGFLGATLVRVAPGFDADEQVLDARYSEQTLQKIREERTGERNVVLFYGRYLGGLMRGDFGRSRSLQRPVAELLADRLPVTLRSIGLGLLGAWGLALALALPGVLKHRWGYEMFSTLTSGIFLCLPSAVVALMFLYLQGPAPLAITLVVFPRVFRYVRNILAEAASQPHVVTAHAKGISNGRILFWHVLPVSGPAILALAGVSVSMAFGASIPVEVICDTPGIGQLAWQAALGRDMSVLVAVTLLVTVVTLAANSTSDALNESLAARTP